MNIHVTGGGGFLGSAVCRQLAAKSCQPGAFHSASTGTAVRK